jgi:hypothetical protein
LTTKRVDEPILVIGFNRPDHLSILIDRLREVRPTNLYFAIDGPRAGKAGEREKVEACHNLVKAIDWECHVQTNFQQENLGCGQGVSTAITWFFDHVERGIILEDDIIPVPSFFGFCSELLDRYEVDDRVFAISGCNFVPPEHQSHPHEAYRFSQIPHIWGWATWRRSWLQHKLDIAGWTRRLPPHRLWARSGHSIPGSVYWAGMFELLARKQIDTWDGQLVLASMVTGGLTATSNVTLIQNIGFDDQATHTRVDRHDLPEPQAIELPTRPVQVVLDSKADAWTRKHHFRATWPGMFAQAKTYLRGKVRVGS